MRVGIIGSGNIGSALARHLVGKGHDVLISNSKGPDSLKEIAAETGAKPATVEEAAGAKDIVIMAVPESAIPNLPRHILSATNAIIVDAGNYYPSRDGQISEIDLGLPESEWVSRTIGHSVVKAFNNILAPSLMSKHRSADDANRVALSVAGNDPNERRTIMKLIEEIGFDSVECGDLKESWRQQPGAPAYCQDLPVAALKSALGAASLADVFRYRKSADDTARPYFVK